MKIKKIIALSVICASSLFAENITLQAFDVNATALSDVSHEQIQSADLANALQKVAPDIALNRRSGIANDIILRGMRKDDINVLVDGTKTYGACPNRMDPPVSHVLANNINTINVVEGPYDVENFGTLSGLVTMDTKTPAKDFHAELDLGMGNFYYRKIGATVSGGSDLIRLMVSGSAETSNQYEDGNGDNFDAQMKKANTPAGSRYQTKYADNQAFEKKTLMTKAFINPTENQELRLSFTANRSNSVLYPSTPMDADYDNSNIYDVAYDIKNLGDFSKKLSLQYYASDVDHPMSTRLRNRYKPNTNPVQIMPITVAHLTSNMQGVKLKDSMDIAGHELLIGVDGSKRNWDGKKYVGSAAPTVMLPDVTTDNAAVFAELSKEYGNLLVKVGVRYDDTKISATNKADLTFNALSANILTNYALNTNNKLIFGLGKSSRVPDAKELYIAENGNKNLDQVTNYEADLGLENSYDNFTLKTKAFYSQLKNYILFNAKAGQMKYENIDASLYGLSINSSYYLSSALTLDAGAAYQVGRKETLATAQADRDLPNITPLKGNLALTYEYKKDSYLKAETIATDAWSKYDADGGEQKVNGWSTLNLKLSHAFSKNVQLDVGVDNVFNTVYAISNTYKDLTLLAGTDSTMLLNEPGRYAYTNLTIKY